MSQTRAIACSQSPSVHCMHVLDNVGFIRPHSVLAAKDIKLH